MQSIVLAMTLFPAIILFPATNHAQDTWTGATTRPDSNGEPLKFQDYATTIDTTMMTTGLLSQTAQQATSPYSYPLPRRLAQLATQPTIPDASGASLPLVSGTSDTPLQIVKSFDGAEQLPYGGTTTWVPPGPTVAVSSTHVVQVLNQTISFFTKTGTLTYRNLLNSSDPTPGVRGFFEDVGAGPIVFAPRVIFDFVAGRFFVVAVEAAGGSTPATSFAFMDIAVSANEDPNGVWSLFRLDTKFVYNAFCPGTVSVADFMDRPSIAVDSSAVYVAGNMFVLTTNCPNLPQGRWQGTRIRVLKKAQLLSGMAVWADIDKNNNPSDPFALQPAQPISATATTFFVNAATAPSSSLRIGRVIDPLGSPQYVSDLVAVPSYLGAVLVPQSDPQTFRMLDPFDGRIVNAVWGNGMLYCAHGIADVDSGNRTLARWYQFDTTTTPPTFVQAGVVDPGAGTHTFYPAVAVNSYGAVGMVFARSSPSELPSIWAVARRSTDPNGAMGPPKLLQESTSAYTDLTNSQVFNTSWWGDTFGICAEPGTSNKFWCSGEWASGTAHWETSIVRFKIANIM